MIIRAIEFLISAVIGIIAAVLSVIILSESVALLLSAIIVGVIVSAIVFGITRNQNTSKLYAVFGFIVSFLIYLYLLITINESPQKLYVLFWIMYVGPYVIFTYLSLVVANKLK